MMPHYFIGVQEGMGMVSRSPQKQNDHQYDIKIENSVLDHFLIETSKKRAALQKTCGISNVSAGFREAD
jgi:hypothetical protein